MKKIFLLLFLLMLSTSVLTISLLHVNATFNDESTENTEETIETYEDASTRSVPGGEDTQGETWYYLTLDNNGIPSQYQYIDYSANLKLLTYLKPGDIIYETNDSIVGDFTGHIAIVYDILWDEEYQQHYVSIIEAYTDGVGYGIMTPNRFKEKEVIIYRLTTASESQIQGALAWIKGQLVRLLIWK